MRTRLILIYCFLLAAGLLTSNTGHGQTIPPGAYLPLIQRADSMVEVLIADGRFTWLVKVLQATGVESELRPGQFTLLAPTDAAFDALPEGALAQLLADPSGQLTDIMRYHLIGGALLSADISNNMTATTLQGQPVRFEKQGTSLKVNGANIIERDIEATNGVIHVIDAVILPPPE